MRVYFIASLVAVATLCKSVDAFPSGAGGCSAGNTAVQGAHLVNPTTGSLADGGLSISLAGVTLAAGSTTTFPVSADTVITVTSTTKSFKGFLLRLGETGGVSTDAAWSFTGTNIQKAGACFDVGGVTHTNADSKTSISATLSLPTAATAMPLDVTVVIANKNGISEYYYSQFILTAAAAVATSAPVLPVTPAPVLPVTPAPVLPATPAPVLPVTPAPVLPVTPAPITKTPTTKAPTSAVPVPFTTAPVLPVTPAPVTKAPLPAPISPGPVTMTPRPVDAATTPAPIIRDTPSPIAAPETPSPIVATSAPVPVVTSSAPMVSVTPAPTLGTPVIAPDSSSNPSAFEVPGGAGGKKKKQNKSKASGGGAGGNGKKNQGKKENARSFWD